MIVFGLMTISNVRHSRNRIYHSTAHVLTVSQSKSTKRSNKADHHLLVILFVQVILLGVLAIPLSIEKLYSTFTSEEVKSNFRVAMGNMLYNFVEGVGVDMNIPLIYRYPPLIVRHCVLQGYRRS
ncbi:unnamed protein product [Adineta steineri]|uniref:Uncharacterized protein n=1 Tax=Adineta steineri TaxID=433720 RepID=A0A816A9I7_9BILA|nr:unnamed protein product [Adineta steineri]CAF1593030.1 unnamed protein product [Adineta steineri]